MLAQKFNFSIDAVEIMEPAYLQAKENVAISLFKNKINVFHADIKDFAGGKKYDLIISNPPFFESDLKSPDKSKNVAMHDSTLKLNELINIVSEALMPGGLFAVLQPFHRTDYFIEAAEKATLHLLKQIKVKQTPAHGYFRSILFFERKKSTPTTVEITIKNHEGNYTDQFVSLLRNYYLKL
jgi:tRNA1Val (adenine37-N6)-methyltransferase